METNIQKPMSQQTLQQGVLAKQKTDSKTIKPASRSEYCQATKPATMKPATAKGAGGRGEAFRLINYWLKSVNYYLVNIINIILG